MAGKTVLITGSTDGMGREVATRLGELGAHVIVHGRNQARGDEVVAEINAGPGTAEFYQADLGNLDQVRDLAARVILNHQQLHLLINNAGLGSGFADGQRTLSADGHEMIFQVNYLAHYLLTDLLLPTIKASAPARIVNVASGAQSPINFEDVMLENSFDGRTAYAQSKLAQILHTFHVAEQLEGTGVTFTTLHPATMMDTTMVAMSGRPAMTTVDEGATALMNLAVSAELEGRSGIYFNGLNEARAHEQAYDRAARERLDRLSRRLVGLP
jgi:NAD(P)-dependent dehydrogenase (short-subunit alcohol dehydrogenase family)